MMTASTARLSPSLAMMALTVASRSARNTFSIFIASTTASGSPALTSCPTTTAMERTSPGIGHNSAFDVSAAFFANISAASCASRFVYTRASAAAPAWERRAPLSAGRT